MQLKQMQEFEYQGVNKQGRKIAATIQSESKHLVKQELVEQGFTSIKVRAKDKLSFLQSSLSAKDICNFTRSLATLLQAGLPVVSCLQILNKDNHNRPLSLLVNRLISRLNMGHPLSAELRFWPCYFNPFYCELVEAGELVGRLDESFIRLTHYLEHKQALKNKINKALMYPFTVLIVAIIVVGVLLIKVIPSFKEIFTSFGRSLPEPTLLVMGWSENIQQFWPWIIVVILVSFLLYKFGCRYIGFCLIRDRLVLKLPILGLITTKYLYANISQTCYTLFSSGIPIHQVLASAAKSCDNLVYKNALIAVQAQVSSGTMLHLAMEDNKLFSETFIQLLAIGEESGKLESCLLKLSDIYQSEVEYDIDKFTNLIEPSVMVFMGIIVGGLVLVMYLPIFDISSAI